MFSRILFAAGLVSLAVGAAVHHYGHVGEHHHFVHQPVVIMHHEPMQQVLHHHVEPVMYVYPVNSRAYMQGQTAATASCTLSPSSPDGLVRGLVTLHQLNPNAPVLVSGTVEGLEPGMHGFHLHRDGNTDNMCKAAGPHFNPANHTHGGPSDYTRHAGDFGNIDADQNGVAAISFASYGISLVHNTPESVLGRAFVVHAKADDLGKGRDAESLKTGNAGARVACCVVTSH